MSDATQALKSITPKKREQLHISGVNMLEECGKRFEFRYILGIRRPPAFYVPVGSAVHGSITANLQHKITTKELMKRSDLIDYAATAFERQIDKEKPELDPDDKREGKSYETVKGENKDKSLALSGLHYDEAAPNIQAKSVERRFSIDMDAWLRKRAKALHAQADLEQDPYHAKLLHSEARALNSASRSGLDLAGEQDVVEEIIADPSHFPLLTGTLPTGIVIRDAKTAAKSPTKSLLDGSESPGIADDSDQLTTYALASLVLDKKLPDLMVLDYLVYTKAKNTKYLATKTTRNMDDINTFLNRFANAVHAYKRGIFVPAKADWWGCSEKYCGYWSMCPYAKRPKLVQIGDVPK